MRVNWEEELSDSFVRQMYTGFVNGTNSRREMEFTFRNTKHAGPFRALVTNGGIKRAKAVAKKALSRRALV